MKVALAYLLIFAGITWMMCQMSPKSLIGIGLALAFVASVFIGFAIQVRSGGSSLPDDSGN